MERDLKEKVKYVYAPGCALMSYKPQLAEKLKEFVKNRYGEIETLLTCCFHQPELEAGTHIITPCATCASRYEKLYPHCRVEFILSAIADSIDFSFPDYNGEEMSIQDTCSSRMVPQYQKCVRKLLERMNVKLVEPEKTGPKAKCCGQVFYGKLETEKVRRQMKIRADEMPREDVVVYCASCIMSMTVGGKKPRFILDLLFSEPTVMQDAEVESWNRKLIHFRNENKR